MVLDAAKAGTPPVETQKASKKEKEVWSPTPSPAKNVEVVHRGQRDVIDVLGIWCEWKTTEDETNHHYCVMEMTLPPGSGVPLHHHAVQETFTMMDGSAEFGTAMYNGRGRMAADCHWRCRQWYRTGRFTDSGNPECAGGEDPTHLRRRFGGVFSGVRDSRAAARVGSEGDSAIPVVT